MACSLKSFGSSVKYGGASAAERLSRPLDRNRNRPLAGSSERTEELTGRDLAEIVKLLECKLAWYGFRSVEVGPFIRVNHHTISIDLLERGAVLCRIEVDRDSGAITRSGGQALRALVAPLQTERPKLHHF
jgi:hypothetical protein